jgi:signal peptidase II
MPQRRAVIFAAILVLVIGFDQGSKAWARTLPVHPAGCAVPADVITHRCAGVPQPVIDGYWDWELAFNTGAAFSSLTNSQLLLGLLACGALIALLVMAWRTAPEQRLRRIALAMIAGGALGNLIDRLRDGAVTDFVRWRVGEARWPIFNVADAALLIGVVLLVAESFLRPRRAAAAAAA